jgi:hypothetical protein
MRYSVHSIVNISQQDIETEVNLAYGKLYINELDGTINVSDMYSNRYICGDSYRVIEEFPDFNLVDNYNGSILTVVKDIYGNLVIAATLPSIRLNKLSDFNEPLTRDDSYLAFFNGQLTGLSVPTMTLPELADVYILNIASKDNYVLRWNTTAGVRINRLNSNIPKDQLGTSIEGYWDLASEASTIVSFDDGYSDSNNPWQIFRIPNISEQSRYLYVNSPLSIKWDAEPKLSGSLEGNKHSIINQAYKTKSYVLNTVISTVSINPSETASVILTPSSLVRLIEIYINTAFLVSDSLVHIGIMLQNYNGSIKFINRVVYENGKTPIINNYTTLLSVSILKEADVTITVKQKAMSMRT